MYRRLSVDAILGAAKFMHTVIASECTGCELCVAPCPVDCIVMKPLPTPIDKEQSLIQGRNTLKHNWQSGVMMCAVCVKKEKHRKSRAGETKKS